MARHSIKDFHFPLSEFSAARLHRASKVFGFLLPTKNNQFPHLIDGDGEGMIVMPLAGPKAFNRYSFSLGSTLEGCLFSDVKIAVDVSSGINFGEDPKLGDVRIADGRAEILSIDGNSGWSDVEPFPLSVELTTTAENPITFKKWSILQDYQADEVELWHNNPEAS